MNRASPYSTQQSLGEQIPDTAKDYAERARELGQDAIDRADEYLQPVGLSLRERPVTTLAVFAGLAFAAGAYWMLKSSRRSRLEELFAQLPDLSRKSRSWW
jgi:hypothetical protein